MIGDWNDLKYFLAVARTGRLTAAAKRLAVNHSTVDRRIRALEQALKANLFERLPAGYRLTPCGEELLPFAEKIESLWLGASSRVSGADIQLSGSVRIGAPDGLGTMFLAPRLARLSEQFPELEIELVAMPRVLNPSKREVDITFGLTRPTQGRLISRKVTDYSLHLYASRSYLAAHGAPKNVGDLVSRPMIGYIKDLIFARELDYLADFGDGLVPRLTSTNLIAQVMMTLEGRGICVLPYYVARRYPELEPVLPNQSIMRSYYMILGEDIVHIARIRHVADAVTQWMKESKAELVKPGLDIRAID